MAVISLALLTPAVDYWCPNCGRALLSPQNQTLGIVIWGLLEDITPDHMHRFIHPSHRPELECTSGIVFPAQRTSILVSPHYQSPHKYFPAPSQIVAVTQVWLSTGKLQGSQWSSPWGVQLLREGKVQHPKGATFWTKEKKACSFLCLRAPKIHCSPILKGKIKSIQRSTF